VPVGANLVGIRLGPRANQVLYGALESGGAGGLEKALEKGERSFVHEGPQLMGMNVVQRNGEHQSTSYGKM
jgi:hypothetical protein